MLNYLYAVTLMLQYIFILFTDIGTVICTFTAFVYLITTKDLKYYLMNS